MISVFTDFDGTLIDLAATPDAVIIPPPLPTLLVALSAKLNGALAIVTGRRIDTVDRLLNPYKGAAVGVHGAEYRLNARSTIALNAVTSKASVALKNALVALKQKYANLLIEDKSHAIAVHCDDVSSINLLNHDLNLLLKTHQPDWHCLQGRHVVELKPSMVNKGAGLIEMMSTPSFINTIPVAIGDDTTDLDLFTAVRQYDGLTISVGERIKNNADIHLAAPASVRQFLTAWASSSEGAINSIKDVRQLLQKV